MANYNACWRTNDFRVKDPAKFRKELMQWYDIEYINDEQEDELWLGGYCPMPNCRDDPECLDDDPYDANFAEFIQEHLAEGSTAEIMEIGYEKLRYLNAFKATITPDEIKWENLGIG